GSTTSPASPFSTLALPISLNARIRTRSPGRKNLPTQCSSLMNESTCCAVLLSLHQQAQPRFNLAPAKRRNAFLVAAIHLSEGTTMEKEQVTGKVDELKGKAKRGVGKAAG